MTLLDLLVLLHPTGDAAHAKAGVLLVTAPDEAVRLAPGDIAYVQASPRRRRALLRRLRGHGIRPTAAFAHVRDGEAGDTIVQLDRRALVYAAGTLLSTPPWLRVAASLAPSPVLRIAALVLPRIGVVCRSEQDAPLAAWMGDGRTEPVRALILRRTHTGGRDHRFVYSLAPRPMFVKLDGGERERQQLQELAPLLQRAGALVPRPVITLRAPAGALAVTLLPGRQASTAIAAGAVGAEEVVERLAAWLSRWNTATAERAVVTEQLLEQEVFAPLGVLEEHLAAGAYYRDWLQQRSTAWLGADLPLVAAHLDLTMANVLLSRGGAVAVVDWAEARARSLPLVDLFYATADAAAALRSYRDRAEAFRSGSYSRLVADVEDRLSRDLDLSPAVRELCFHACWLHHACNELHRGGAETPFRQIVDVVAVRVTRR